MTSRLEQNKQNAIRFYEVMFNDCKPRDALQKYVGDADPWSIWTTSRERDVRARITDPRHPDMDGKPDRERIALDGIVLDSLDDTLVRGRLEELGGWYEFSLSLSAMTVERGRQITGLEAGIQADYARGFPPSEVARARSASYAL